MATSNEHTPWGQLADRYWTESRRPLASLVFLAPLLLIYEMGVTMFGAPQNGADAFLRHTLELLGFGQHLLLPMLTIGILLAWHYLSRESWQLSGGILSAMAVESILLGVCLRVISFVQHTLVTLSIGQKIQEAVGFLGAGIYEELLFRLILLSGIRWAFRRAGMSPRVSTIVAITISSVLFAAAHHVGPYGDPLDLYRLLFRFIAGVFFAILFLYRGFGITAGSHAAYDILVGAFG